jgi:hypothetical protein
MADHRNTHHRISTIALVGGSAVVIAVGSLAAASAAGRHASSAPASKTYVKHEIKHLAPTLSVKAAKKAKHAKSAGNAAALGGQPPSAFEPRAMWAYVLADGTIGAQSGGISLAFHSGSFPGQYYLQFPQSLLNSSVQVTPHYDQAVSVAAQVTTGVCGDTSSTDSPSSGQIKCTVGGNTASELYLLLTDSAGSAKNQGFYVTIMS